jgi:protein-L-isoaspartate(D-aspartate) O-methyltransferase
MSAAELPRFQPQPRDTAMTDFAAARSHMLDGQVRTSDVTDLRILWAMQTVERERFVPAKSRDLAYVDFDLPVGNGRCLLKPRVLAKMLQVANVRPDDRILDVGCAIGYAPAILARIAAQVTALEENAELAAAAREALAGEKNVQVVTGALAGGYKAAAPYDVIVIEGATEVEPDALLRQLSDGGRLVCILGGGPAAKSMLYTRSGDDAGGRPVFDAAAPVLPGFAKPPEFAF